ncbi:5_t:CDS:1, partial [Racocetra persica]
MPAYFCVIKALSLRFKVFYSEEVIEIKSSGCKQNMNQKVYKEK